MLDIRIDDIPYKTVKSMLELCYEIGKFMFNKKNPFYTIQVINKEGHELAYIDVDILKAFK